MLDLECLDCILNKNSQQYTANLSDNEQNKYQLIIYDFVPKYKVIRLNRFYHNFIDKENYTQIIVKQKYDFANQPSVLELELINLYRLRSSAIITLRDTNNSDTYKMKVDSVNNDLGSVEIYDLQKANMIIYSMPHYYEKYMIENWIFPNNILEIL